MFRVKASTEIDDFNEPLGTHSPTRNSIPSADWSARFGHLPKRGEQLLKIDQLNFRVLRADSRRIYLLQVAKSSTNLQLDS